MVAKFGCIKPCNIVANSDDQESNHDEFYESESKSPITQMDSVSLSDNTLDRPKQPILKSYDPKKVGNENATRNFISDWYNDHPWLEYSVEDKTASYYACQKFICKEFVFSNWKKPKRLIKHYKSQDRSIAMAKSIAFSKIIRGNTSVAKELDDKRREEVQRNREYLRVLIECLVFTAQ